MAVKDKYNRRDYSTVLFVVLLVLVAAYIMLKDLGVLSR